MQTVRGGMFGAISEFNDKNLKEALEDPEVDHVEVFNGTPTEIIRRKKLIGKALSVAKRYKKAPAIHGKKRKK